MYGILQTVETSNFLKDCVLCEVSTLSITVKHLLFA